MSQRPRGARLARRTPTPPAPRPVNGWGIGGAVLGVLSLVLTCTVVPVIFLPHLVAGVALVAIVLSGLGLRSARRAGGGVLWPIVGIVCAVLPLLLSLLWLYVVMSSAGA